MPFFCPANQTSPVGAGGHVVRIVALGQLVVPGALCQSGGGSEGEGSQEDQRNQQAMHRSLLRC